jgi:predicted ATPase
MRRDLPSGTVTFLFTDVEGSTRLLHSLGAEGYAEALAEHRRVIREACTAEGGVEVDTQGDAFFFAFPTAPGALAAASAFTDALASGPIQVRVGLHTGTPLLTEEGYVGDDVHFAARVAATSHGGQVVVSAQTAELVDHELTELGEHRLKDIEQPVPIFQLGEGSFAPLKTISNTNLPRPASSFLGREAELQEVLARIEQGARLVTLTGPGGTGKTRLAIEAASSLVGEYKAGVFWVGLASLRDPGLVTDTIAQTLGARDDLATHIAERELLLLLDNLEQVVEAAPELSALISACPNLTLLVTSRELLRVSGEVEYPVPPLAEPEAIELFCARSQLEPAAEIAELCARLDSLPLAVELAAARTKALSPAQILERLSARLDLLKGGRDADPRQQTLRATIEWSYDLLSPEEQQLFARLSVFAGGCTLQAAEEVAEADLDTLQSLVEKSLLHFSSGRYWLLETTREYAAERLEQASGAEETRIRHVEHYVRMAENLEPKLGQADAIGSVRVEEGNLRTALSFAHTRAPEAMLRIAGALWRYWYLRVQVVEGRGWLEQALSGSQEVPSSARARALRGLAALEQRAGNEEAAVAPLQAALAMYRLLADDDGVARCLNNLGVDAVQRFDFDEATRLYEEALAIGRRLADDGTGPGVAHPLMNLAEIALERGDLPAARRLAEEAIAAARQQHDDAALVQAETVLTWLAVHEERFGEAARLLRGALATADDLEVRYVGGTLLLVALVAAARGRERDAARLWGAIGAQRARVGVRGWTEDQRETRYYAPYVELERQLVAAGYEAHFEEGAAMSFEEVLQLARRVVD